MRRAIQIFILAPSLVWSLQSCQTDDVTPLVSLEATESNLDVGGGTTQILARLNGPVNNDVSVSIGFSGTAALGEDFVASSNQIKVASGSTTGAITLTGVASGDTTSKFIEVVITSARNADLGAPTAVTIGIIDCLGDVDGDGVPNCEDGCPNVAGPIENNGCPWLGLVINEVLYDPPPGAAGDANNDGTRDPLEDEFVELYIDSTDMDLSGYTLSDASMVRHTFPEGTVVPSRTAIVVFGGGTPTGSFGGSMVQTASEGQLNLNNAGDVLTVRDADGNTVGVFDINPLSGNPDEAYTRNPDITGDFERHPSIPEANGALFSPGTRLDGTGF